MKKNKMMRIASVLLVAVLLSTCAISGTYAKYVTEATGSDAARVAKWNVQLEGTKMTNTFTFDLFNTVYDSNGTDVEQDIADNTGGIIAPGTQGSFVLNLKNDSEVNAEYTIDYTLSNSSNIPVEFSVDGTNWYKDIDKLDVTDVAFAMGNAPAITIQWRWVFNGDDTFDTGLGEAAVGADIVLSVEAKVTVEQVD